MTCHLTLTIEFQDQLIAGLRNQVDQPHPTALREVMTLLKSAMLGNTRAFARLQLASAVASQTINVDVSDMVADTDTTVIDGITLTWVAASANENQITIPATDALGAAALAAAINAHSTISKLVWAAVTGSATGDVTVYAVLPGTAGNGITLTEAGNGITVGGATLAGGAGDEVDTFNLGYSPTGAVEG
jgi:anti-sigma factor RsiW